MIAERSSSRFKPVHQCEKTGFLRLTALLLLLSGPGREPAEAHFHALPMPLLNHPSQPLQTESFPHNLRDIVPPVELPKSFLMGWPGILGGLAGLSLLGLAWCKRRHRGGHEAVPRELTAEELAWQTLEDLRAEAFAARGQVKEFYQIITNILRRHFEDRLGLPVREQTTSEFLAALDHEARLGTAEKQLLRELLFHCDFVKFAEHQPTPGDMANSLACCRVLIDQNRLLQTRTPSSDRGRLDASLIEEMAPSNPRLKPPVL